MNYADICNKNSSIYAQEVSHLAIIHINRTIVHELRLCYDKMYRTKVPNRRKGGRTWTRTKCH